MPSNVVDGWPLRREITAALNKHSAENNSDTPDYILAEYLMACLRVFDNATRERDQWHGWKPWDKIRTEASDAEGE